MKHQASFIIAGRVTRKYMGDNFALLSIKTELEGGSPRHDCAAFDTDTRAKIAQLDGTMEVKVSGRLQSTKLKDKKKNSIYIDGYEKWVPQIVIDEILEIEKIRNDDFVNSPSQSDDDIPF